jgi:hypothetical protein
MRCTRLSQPPAFGAYLLLSLLPRVLQRACHVNPNLSATCQLLKRQEKLDPSIFGPIQWVKTGSFQIGSHYPHLVHGFQVMTHLTDPLIQPDSKPVPNQVIKLGSLTSVQYRFSKPGHQVQIESIQGFQNRFLNRVLNRSKKQPSSQKTRKVHQHFQILEYMLIVVISYLLGNLHQI